MQLEKMKKKIQEASETTRFFDGRKNSLAGQLEEAKREHAYAKGRMEQLVEVFQEMYPGENPFPKPPQQGTEKPKGPVERMPSARKKTE